MVAAAARPGTDERRTVRYWPRGAAAELFRHHEAEIVLAGPAGTGKTYGCLWRMHLAARKYAGMRGILVRKTLESLTASALVTYQQRVLKLGKWGVEPFGGSKLRPAGFLYPNGSEILIGGLDKPDKVMSQEYDLVYVNEATDLTPEDWEAITTRTRYGVMPYQQLFGDCNPQSPGHWLFKRIQAGTTTMLTSVHQDNPALWDGTDWTDQGRAYLATLANLTGHRRQRLLEGLWVNAEGAVYPAFNRAQHVQIVDTTGWRHVLGVDSGVRNPTAILDIAFGSERVHVAREVYRRGMGSRDQVEAVKHMADAVDAQAIYVDPSAAALITDLEADGYPVIKANNNVSDGVAAVTTALIDGLTVDPSCVNTIAEFEDYHYPEGRRQETDKPVKQGDHAMDALRYAVLGESTPAGFVIPHIPPPVGFTGESTWAGVNG